MANFKTRINELKSLCPFYPRMPHFDRIISNTTTDDIVVDGITLPIEGWVSEKVDGANMAASWTNGGPVIRNRDHILKKGWMKTQTPAKIQFRPAWNWVHDNKKEIIKLSQILDTEVTLYGEWMNFKHSILYDKLPDLFLIYDIYLPEEKEFLSPKLFNEVMKDTNLHFIQSKKIIISNKSDLISLSELPSNYIKSGIREGIVVKTGEGRWRETSFKVVNKFFTRREDFNEEIIQNKVIHKK